MLRFFKTYWMKPKVWWAQYPVRDASQRFTKWMKPRYMLGIVASLFLQPAPSALWVCAAVLWKEKEPQTAPDIPFSHCLLSLISLGKENEQCSVNGKVLQEQAPLSSWAFPFCLISEQRAVHCIWSLVGCQKQKVDDTHQDFRTQGSMHCVKYSSENYVIYQADVIPSRGSGDAANHIIQL